MERIKLPHMDARLVSKEIGDFLIDAIKDRGATGCAVGLSGGVDSTTVAAIAKRAFDEHRKATGESLELVGYILPSSTNDQSDTRDGLTVAGRLGIRRETRGLEPLLASYRITNPEAFENKYDLGNLTSRVRASVLNTKAATENKTLAGTGNRDEDYGIGYYTLFGDGAVHISPIGGLSKRLVREMASHLGFADLAHREPAAGLEPGQTDFKDLGYRYDVVELVSEGLDQGFTPGQLAAHEQVAPVIARQQHDYARLFGAPKFATPQAAIDDIVSRKRTAERKASLIHPATPTITLEYR